MCVIIHLWVIPMFPWTQVVYPPFSCWCDLRVMHILFRDISVCYLTRLIIFLLVVLVFVWYSLHSWGLGAHSCAFITHSCIVDINSFYFHVYCLIYSTVSNVIIYCVQDCCFLSVSHSWCLVCRVIIHCLLFIIFWSTFGVGVALAPAPSSWVAPSS